MARSFKALSRNSSSGSLWRLQSGWVLEALSEAETHSAGAGWQGPPLGPVAKTSANSEKDFSSAAELPAPKGTARAGLARMFR